MEPEIKELGLKALLEKGEIEKFFDVQMKEKDGQAKGQLIGSIARIADMVTQHSEGVFVDEISQRLSEKLAELASQLASGLEADLKGTEDDLRRFVETTDAESRSEILADLAEKVDNAESNLSRQIQNTLDAAMPELADAARLTEDEKQELVDFASLSVESQMSELIGAYFADNALTPDEIQGFRQTVQSMIDSKELDMSALSMKFDQLTDLPVALKRFLNTGGKFRVRSMLDVKNWDDFQDGYALVWDAADKKLKPSEVSALPDQTGNSGKFLTTDGTTASWATLAGGGDMAVATYDPNGVGSDAFTMTNMNGGNWKVFYTNGTGDVTELTLGADGTYLMSNGATSAPSFETVSASVSSLDDIGDVTITSVANDEVLQYTGAGWENQTLAEAGIAAASHTHATTDITSGTFADARIAESNVTQHQAALTITESQISDLGTYQPLDAQLTSLAGLVPGAEGRLIESDGLGGFQMADATTAVTNAGALMDSEVDADIKTLSLPANTTISAFGATLVDDADAATARTTLGVDAAGTDNSTDVTLAGTPDYLTLSGQQITLGQIDLTTDVTGVLPEANLPDASTTAQGVVELATASEVNGGSDTSRAITSDALAGSYAGQKSVGVMLVAPGTDVATGTSQAFLTIPEDVAGMNLVSVHAEHATAGTTGVSTYDINKNGTSMLSTKLTVDSAETGSDTAATAAVIDGTQNPVSENDVITIDVDGVSTTAPQGAFIRLTFQLP